MPIYEIQSPEGQTFEIEGDSPPTEQELSQMFKQEEPVKLIPDFLSFDSKEAKQKRDELFQQDPDKYLSIMQKSGIEGFNRGLKDIGEGLKQFTLEAGEFLGVSDPEITQNYTQKVQEERERFEETYGMFPGSKVTRFLGGSAPYAYLPIKMPAGLFKRIGVSSALGGAVAGTRFVDEGDSRALNMAAGATVGAAIPAIGAALSGALKWSNELLVQPFKKQGAYKDIAKFLQREITENREKIEKAIQESIDRGENKSVAQVIAEYTHGTSDDFGGMLARLERDLSKESDVLKSIYATQSVARRGILDKIAGTQDDLAKAMTTRSNNAAVNYKKAFEVPINADNELVKLSNNKYMQVAISDAKDIAQAKGVDSKKQLTEFLHYVKEGLDKQLHATDAMGKTALGREEVAVVNELKTNLIKWLKKKNTLYEKARNQFEADSIPVNKMELGNELKKAFISALDENKPSTFANAMQNINKKIKQTTGLSKKVEDVLTKEDVRGLEALKKGLAVDAHKAKMATKSKPILKELTGEMTLSLPHILSRPIVITNHLLKILSHDKTPEYKRLLVDIIRNQKKFLDAYRLPETTKEAQMATDIVRRLNIIAGSQAAEGAINE
jgi:hypothetical protein